MSNCQPSHSNIRQRAFSLIEAAIVLGVIGLIIGGIWTAADSVRFQRNINDTKIGYLQLVRGLRTNVTFETWPTTGSLDMTVHAMRMKLGPDNWLATSSYITPFGQRLTILLYAGDSTPHGSLLGQRTINLTTIFTSKTEANRFIRELAIAQKDGLVYVYCGPYGAGTVDWSALVTTAPLTPACIDQSAGISVRAYFTL